MHRTWTAFGAGVFVYALIRLILIGWDYGEHQAALAEARRLYADGQALLEINPDIAGWIRIDGTRIDYPVVQSRDNNDYLHRNYKGEEARAGSIFLDFRTSPDAGPRHTIVYGHRMKDGTMFGELKRYMNRDYYDEHRIIRFDTPGRSYTAEIFSVYPTTTDFNYIQTEFADEAEYVAFLREIRGRSLYPSEAEPSGEDRIMTLSTCDYLLDPAEGRLAVHARLQP